MNGSVHLRILYSLFRKIGEAGRSDWVWTLWREKVSIIINYHLPLINCSIEIKCLHLCLSKICLDLFETSLMLLGNLRQGELSDQAGRKVCFSLSQRKEGYCEHVLFKATLSLRGFLRILIISKIVCLETLVHRGCMPWWTWFLHLLVLAITANPWFKPATYQIAMLLESFSGNKINPCKLFG